MNETLKRMTTNWKTTAAGLVAGAPLVYEQMILLTDADPLTMPDWNVVALGIGLIFGLALTRDSSVSSERSAAK